MFVPGANFIAPCLPTRSLKAPSGSGWVHEIKHDGYRLIARDGRTISLASRQCRGSTGISQNGVSGVPLWDPVFAPLLVLPFNHSSCISVSQDSGW